MTSNRRKITKAQQFMNTTITITVIKTGDAKTVDINNAIAAAFGEFDRIVKKFTRFNQDSELSNLNRNSGNWTQVSAEFLMLIEKMLELSRATNGAFDPTVIDFLETYGYDSKYDFSKLDNPDLDKNVKHMAQTRPSWKQIEIDKSQNKVKLMPGQRIDLGGIGKGYAIDCAYAHLDKYADFLIDGGGDIRCKGLNDKNLPWQLELLHKNKLDESGKPEAIGVVNITDQAIACSGSWARRVKQFHHILDPQTGAPIESMQTVYVSAPDATTADSWATALFVGGTDLLANLEPDMGALLIDASNKAIITNQFPTPI